MSPPAPPTQNTGKFAGPPHPCRHGFGAGLLPAVTPHTGDLWPTQMVLGFAGAPAFVVGRMFGFSPQLVAQSPLRSRQPTALPVPEAGAPHSSAAPKGPKAPTRPHTPVIPPPRPTLQKPKPRQECCAEVSTKLQGDLRSRVADTGKKSGSVRPSYRCTDPLRCPPKRGHVAPETQAAGLFGGLHAIAPAAVTLARLAMA
jgi:hypothetical protein